MGTVKLHKKGTCKFARYIQSLFILLGKEVKDTISFSFLVVEVIFKQYFLLFNKKLIGITILATTLINQRKKEYIFNFVAKGDRPFIEE